MMHTGKIRGTFGEVLPKVKTLRGAMRVITPEGRGVVLVDAGKPLAAYLKAGEKTFRGRESLAILEAEPMAEYDLVAYEDSEFSEAMGICASEGLRLEKGTAAPAEEAVTSGSEKGGGLLSHFLRRFSGGEKEAAPVPPPPPVREERVPEPEPPLRKEPEPVFPPPPVLRAEEKPPGGGIPVTVTPPPAAPAEEGSELSAIVKRLSRSMKERGAAGAAAPAAQAPPVPPAVPEPVPPHATPSPAPAQGETPRATPPPRAPAGQGEGAEGTGDDTLDEILKRYKSGGKGAAPVARAADLPRSPAPAAEEEGDHASVELNAMMKRITRLDIVSFKKEMADVKTAAHRDEVTVQPPGDIPGEMATVEPAPHSPVVVPAPEAMPAEEAPREPTRPSSDIDDLKAFIQRLEHMEPAVPEPEVVTSAEVPLPVVEPPPPPAKERPGITILPGVLGGERIRPREAAESPAGGARKPAPLRFGEPLEADRIGEDRPVVLPEIPAAAEKPSREVIIQWKKDEPLSGAAAGTATGAGGAQAEVPRRRPIILKRELDIRRVERRPERPRPALPLLDEQQVDRIMRQPGVLAVSVFQEGFAVQSVGKADFDQVAANAEDLLRAGTKIASDIRIGSLHQIILESEGGKLIISPYGDLNLCVFTDADANLGLIRVAIRSLQAE